MKREIPVALGFMAGFLILITTYFTGSALMQTVRDELSTLVPDCRCFHGICRCHKSGQNSK